MTNVRRLLCPIDVLDAGQRRGLEYASRLAEALGADLHALYVFDVPGFVDPDPEAPLVRAYAERALGEHRERFAALIDHLPGAFAEPHLVPGRPHREIAEAVERLGADLVVMSTHARAGLSRAFLGSIAERVVRASRIPVLTVPRDGDPPASPPRSLLVPDDFSTASRRALRAARDLHVPLHASVAVLHVLPDELSPVAAAPAWLSEEERARYRGLLEESLDRDVREIFGPEEQAVTRVVEHGSTAERILACAAARRAQLLVVGASGKSGTERMLLGSVTIELLRSSPVPVLTVP